MSRLSDAKPSHERIILASVESRRAARTFLYVLFALFVISTAFTKFNPIDALLAQGEFWNFIFTDFIPPRIQRLGALFTAVKQTLYMAIGATGVSAVLSLILGFLGTPAICRFRLVGALVRGFASLLRNIPVLVWAFILVAAFGIGTAVGVVSLVISTVGELTRYFIETLDEIAGENIEALEATGAGMLPVITQAIVPAAMPSFIAWFLYCLELNIRASTILGMVGAGGIGLLMTGYIKQYNYGAASTAIIAVAAIIIGANLLTDYLRRVIL
ncbi:MAG: ABC transporter permease subunit [Synergistaceae bacterium]|jgi:phosphonate transport system permease protein|nr:ABC transporter permease subunit [Synergistaceae bacterium]